MKQNAFKSLDPKTGRPDVDPDRKPSTGKRVEVCPSLWGGKNWPPIAFSPKTRMIYIPANENLCMTFGGRGGLSIVPGADHIGEVQAWNVDTGKRVWTHPYASSQNWGPMLATGGGLVFSGGTNDRKFHAFDAASGRLFVGAPRPARASRASRRRSWSAADSTSPCSRAGVSTRAACRAR